MTLPKAISKILSKVLPVPKEYEKPLMFLRRHPITFVRPLAVFFALAAAPAVAYLLIPDFFANFWLTEYGQGLLVMGFSVWYSFALLLLFTNFVDFFLDIWVVTNERVIDVLQKGLFARTINEARLYRVQNVRVEVHGIVATMFHFGDVIVETAGETGQLLFDNIPDPNTVARRIMELVENDRQYHEGKIKLENLTTRPRITDAGA